MDDGGMTDRDVIAYDGVVTFECSVDHRVILDVDPVAEADGGDIAAQDSAKPDAATIADYDVTNDGRRRRNVAVLADDRSLAANAYDVCHDGDR